MREHMNRRIEDENVGIIIPKMPERVLPSTPETNDALYIPNGTQLVTEHFDRNGQRIIYSHEQYVTHLLAQGVKIRLDNNRGEN